MGSFKYLNWKVRCQNMFPSLQLHISDCRVLCTSSRVFEGGREKEVRLKSLYLTINYKKLNVCLKRGFKLLIKNKIFRSSDFYLSILPPIVIESWLYFLLLLPDLIQRYPGAFQSINSLFWKGHILLSGSMELNRSKVTFGSRILLLYF